MSLVSYIVLNVHAPTEDKTDDVKDSFYEELERVFHKFQCGNPAQDDELVKTLAT
jgi:hypothetical protein